MGEVYMVGGGDVKETLSRARRFLPFRKKPKSLTPFGPAGRGHDRRYALNCSKITVGLGWRPVIQLDDGLRQTIDWYRANADWLAAVRGGEYRSYYEKYYENRDLSLQAMMSGGARSST